ncbi:hypothetical protein HN011_010873 [Eciton burchellii]|nr:hypothetical protein HN011_010873 [Eciton burchellii]
MIDEIKVRFVFRSIRDYNKIPTILSSLVNDPGADSSRSSNCVIVRRTFFVVEGKLDLLPSDKWAVFHGTMFCRLTDPCLSSADPIPPVSPFETNKVYETETPSPSTPIRIQVSLENAAYCILCATRGYPRIKNPSCEDERIAVIEPLIDIRCPLLL